MLPPHVSSDYNPGRSRSAEAPSDIRTYAICEIEEQCVIKVDVVQDLLHMCIVVLARCKMSRMSNEWRLKLLNNTHDERITTKTIEVQVWAEPP